jgi:alpha-D-ribose 1-methylphosphonate 5-triphosphate diphosphatase PhnM
MIDVLKTLIYMKPSIKVMVIDNDPDLTQYHELEDFRPTTAEILAVDQEAVATFWAEREAAERMNTKDELRAQVADLIAKIDALP